MSLPYVRALSKETVNIIGQNYGIATYSNLAGFILGAMGLITAFCRRLFAYLSLGRHLA